MIVDGWTVGLTLGGAMTLLPLLHGGWVSGRILRGWSPEPGGGGSAACAAGGVGDRGGPHGSASAAAGQLRLEREAELVATIVNVALALFFVQAVLFLLLLDRLADLLAGAMCAVGVLRASSFALPALLAKGAALLAFTVWRTCQRADCCGEGFRFTRLKAALLLGLVLPLALGDFALQSALFIDLRPDAVTSCCATAFRLAPSPTQELLDRLTPTATLGLFLLGLALVLGTGLAALRSTASGRAQLLLAAHGTAALLFFFVFLVAATALFSGYHYGSPAHRCPVCLLRGDPAWLGWPLYLALLAGTGQAVAAATLGLLHRRARGPDELLALARGRVGSALLLLALASGLLAWPALLWQLRHGVSLWS